MFVFSKPERTYSLPDVPVGSSKMIQRVDPAILIAYLVRVEINATVGWILVMHLQAAADLRLAPPAGVTLAQPRPPALPRPIVLVASTPEYLGVVLVVGLRNRQPTLIHIVGAT